MLCRYEQYEMSYAARVGLGVAAEEAVLAQELGSWDRIQAGGPHS